MTKEEWKHARTMIPSWYWSLGHGVEQCNAVFHRWATDKGLDSATRTLFELWLIDENTKERAEQVFMANESLGGATGFLAALRKLRELQQRLDPREFEPQSRKVMTR